MIGLNYKKLNCILLLFLFLFEAFDNALREVQYDITFFKNILLFFMLFVCLFETTTIIKNKNRKFSKQFKRVINICVVFFALSLYYALKQNIFSFDTIIALLKIFIPAFIVYVVLNTVDSKNIYLILKIFLVFSAIAYFILILPILNINNLKSISFINSNSPFESNYFSPISFGLFLYFFYFSKEKWPIYLSFIMILLNFKRPMILAAVLTIILFKFLKSNKEIPKWIIYSLITIFSLSVYFYISALSGTYDAILIKYFGFGINKLTMGRAWLLENALYHYVRSGLATSILNGRSIEMDLIMFYLEMGILSVIVYVYNYYQMCERKIYNVWIITISLFISLTSHFYDISFFWILLYITMGSVLIKQDEINSTKENDSNMNKGVKIQ